MCLAMTEIVKVEIDELGRGEHPYTSTLRGALTPKPYNWREFNINDRAILP
jgi:hypothetical protein